MSYKGLYDYAQTLTPKVSRNDLRDKAIELAGRGDVCTVKTGLDLRVCRGFYLSAKNQEARIVQQTGKNVIVLGRGLNECWERGVYIKELMHLFDDPNESTGSGDELEKLLAELTGGAETERSAQMESEIRCVWMALGVLCPEKDRQGFLKAKAASLTDDYAIALQLRIPQAWVQNLLGKSYDKVLPSLLR